MFDLDGAVQAWRRQFGRERSFATRDLDELEDHLRAAYEVELDLSPGLAPARAFAHACETLGTVDTLSREFAKVEGRAWRRLLRAGWLVYALAFFLPVARYGISLREVNLHEGLLPGVEAFLLALKGAGGVVGILSALTNFVMITTFRRISDAGHDRVWLLTVLMLVAMVLNLWWLFEVDHVSDLYAGYYAWLASFGIAGAGLAMRARALPEEGTSKEVIAEP
jgi:hypothetical protein